MATITLIAYGALALSIGYTTQVILNHLLG